MVLVMIIARIIDWWSQDGAPIAVNSERIFHSLTVEQLSFKGKLTDLKEAFTLWVGVFCQC